MKHTYAIIVMGVAGAGKTTLGLALSKMYNCAFFDADDFHSPSNRKKMAEGIGLSDDDRAEWLLELRDLIKHAFQSKTLMILACSALKERYREVLSVDSSVVFVYLYADAELLKQRMNQRRGHFAHVSLLSSQFEALEIPKNAVSIDARLTTEAQIALVLKELED